MLKPTFEHAGRRIVSYLVKCAQEARAHAGNDDGNDDIVNINDDVDNDAGKILQRSAPTNR